MDELLMDLVSFGGPMAGDSLEELIEQDAQAQILDDEDSPE